MNKTIASSLRIACQAGNYVSRKSKQFIAWYVRRFKQAPWYGRIGIVCATFVASVILLLFLIDINFLWLFGKSPGTGSLKDPIQHVASEIYSADGKLIGKYYSENRTPVEYDEISPILRETLICTEDERFYRHFGIDFEGVFAAAKDFVAHGDARGASTITQQLVKNLFKVRSQYSTGLLGYIPGVKLLIMKAKEWVTAVKIEMMYSKTEILTMYFNTVDFGSNTFGIKTACKTYFDTTPDKVTVEQAATLIGLLKATTYYNPRSHPENSLARRNVVLNNLYTHRKLIHSKHQLDSIQALSIALKFNQETHYTGNALYFREAVAADLRDWCKANNINLYADGLKIYTTIDSRMQHYAEEAVNKQMREVQKRFYAHWGTQAPWRDKTGTEIPNFIEDLAKRTSHYAYLAARYHDEDSINHYLNMPHRCKVFDYDLGQRDTLFSTMDSIRYMEHFMHCGFVAIDPHDGQVKAWVGDIDFQSWKYDKVLSKRQPGSTFKLFVYTEAMNQGLSPCDTRVDVNEPWEVEEKGEKKMWLPHNANGGATLDTMSLKVAFARSINIIAANVAHEIGIANIARTAHAMGIKTRLEETPSLSLGASDVSLLELVSAYGTAINDGKAIDPILVTRIEKDGKTLYESKAAETQAIPYASAFLMQQMLRGGLTCPGGTSQALWRFRIFDKGTEFGGKTGTSSNHSDAWFVGVSPNLVAGAWVGGEYRSIHFRTGELGQGSRTALPVFGYFMEKVLADKQLAPKYVAKFPARPKEDVGGRQWDCNTYLPHYSDSDSIRLMPDSLIIDDEPVDEFDLKSVTGR